jgi:hypothetical protein
MMFAQGLFDSGLQGHLLDIIRGAISVGGAFVGWFVSDPLTRLGYRITFRGPTPGWLLPWMKLSGAAAVALLVWFFLPLGGGEGFGLGKGPGGGPGKGAGDGSGQKVAADKKGKEEKDTKEPPKTPPQLEQVEVEIVPKKDSEAVAAGRFFILRRAGKQAAPINRKELADYFEKNFARIEVIPVLTRDSIGTGPEGNPFDQLLELTREYRVKTDQPKLPEAKSAP